MANIQQPNFSVNLLRALLWEHNQSANLQALLEAKQAWYDAEQTGFWDDWIADVFDLRTCNAFGFTVWAIILGIPLSYILPPDSNPAPPFGFGFDGNDTGANGNQNFYSANFSAQLSQQITLTPDQIRLLLRLRYRQLVSRGTVPEVNKILADLVVPDYGPMYMIDGLNMTQAIKAINGFPAALSFIFTQLDVIPRPAGVKLLLIDASYAPFGFGPDPGQPANTNQNFYNSGFTINGI